MQVLESVNKRLKGGATNNGVPLGGSSSAKMSKQDKIKDLLQTFGIDKRIG